MFNLNHLFMKNHNGEVQSLDDLVFENRNKAYGAYALRKTYNENLNKGVLFVLGAVVLMIILPLIFPSATMDIIPSLPGNKTTEVTILPPIEVEKPKPLTSTNQIRKAVRDIAVHVTTDPVEEVETPVTEAVSGIEDGVEGGAEPEVGAVGVGTEAAVVPVIPEVPVVRDFAEVMPQYEGGLSAMARFLSSKMRYPAVARRMGVEGSVYVSFVINTDGSVIDAKVVKGISKECDAEALRVVSMMSHWSAGRQGNVPVMVRMMLPIKFQLAH